MPGESGVETMANRLPDEREPVEGVRVASAIAADVLKGADM